MAKAKKSSTVPASMQEKYDRITTLTDAFAHQHLNQEYAELIRQATAELCRKRPSPLASGKEATWACGVTHAIGTANFLFDKTHPPTSKSPHSTKPSESQPAQAKANPNLFVTP